MVLFGLEWTNARAPEYMDRIAKRLTTVATTPTGLGRSFLSGKVTKKRGVYILDITPRVPKVYYFLVLLLCAFYLFGMRSWIPYVTLSMIAVFAWCWWQPWFYVWIIRLGYKKQMREKAVVRYLTASMALRRVMGWDK